MNKLKSIYCNCLKATLLIEKKQHGPIRVIEHLELAFHLAFCSFCRTYQKQSRLINLRMKKIAEDTEEEPVLDNEFKESLHKKIIEQLDL